VLAIFVIKVVYFGSVYYHGKVNLVIVDGSVMYGFVELSLTGEYQLNDELTMTLHCTHETGDALTLFISHFTNILRADISLR